MLRLRTGEVFRRPELRIVEVISQVRLSDTQWWLLLFCRDFETWKSFNPRISRLLRKILHVFTPIPSDHIWTQNDSCCAENLLYFTTYKLKFNCDIHHALFHLCRNFRSHLRMLRLIRDWQVFSISRTCPALQANSSTLQGDMECWPPTSEYFHPGNLPRVVIDNSEQNLCRRPTEGTSPTRNIQFQRLQNINLWPSFVGQNMSHDCVPLPQTTWDNYEDRTAKHRQTD